MATATAPVPAPAKPAGVPVQRTANPVDLMRHLAQEMDRVFGEYGLRARWPFTALGEANGALWAPDLEVAESAGRLQVRVDLPGLRKEDVTVEISDDALIVRGERRKEAERSENGYYRSERSYGRFSRSVPLPAGAQPDSVKATFTDGVLEIVMDVSTPQAAATRRVEIA